jgi:hypothetical protein
MFGVHHDALTPSIPVTCGGGRVAPALPRLALADDYPSRPVVGYAPGGVSDILGRLIGQKLSERLGQPFVAENSAAVVVVKGWSDASLFDCVLPRRERQIGA